MARDFHKNLQRKPLSSFADELEGGRGHEPFEPQGHLPTGITCRGPVRDDEFAAAIRLEPETRVPECRREAGFCGGAFTLSLSTLHASGDDEVAANRRLRATGGYFWGYSYPIRSADRGRCSFTFRLIGKIQIGS